MSISKTMFEKLQNACKYFMSQWKYVEPLKDASDEVELILKISGLTDLELQELITKLEEKARYKKDKEKLSEYLFTLREVSREFERKIRSGEMKEMIKELANEIFKVNPRWEVYVETLEKIPSDVVINIMKYHPKYVFYPHEKLKEAIEDEKFSLVYELPYFVYGLLAKFGSVKNFRIYFAGEPLGLSPDAELSILSYAFKHTYLWYILNKDEMANFISDFLQKTGLKIQREGLSKETSEYIAVLDIQDPEYLFILGITPAAEVGKANLFRYRITIAEPAYLKKLLDGSATSYLRYFNIDIVKGFYSFDDPAGFERHIEDMVSKAKKMIEFIRGIEKTFTSEFGEADYSRTDGIYYIPEAGQGKYVIGLSKTLTRGDISLDVDIKPYDVRINFNKYEHMNMKIFHDQEKKIVESLGYEYRNRSGGYVLFYKGFRYPFPADDPAKGAEEIIKDILNEYNHMINMVIDARESIKSGKAKKYRSNPVTFEREDVARAFWLEVIRILLIKSHIYGYLAYINMFIIDKIYEQMDAKDKQYVYILSKKLGVAHKVNEMSSMGDYNRIKYGEGLLDKLISESALTLDRVNNKVNIYVFGKAYDLQSILSKAGDDVDIRGILTSILSAYIDIHITMGRIDKLFWDLVRAGMPEKKAASTIADKVFALMDSTSFREYAFLAYEGINYIQEVFKRILLNMLNTYIGDKPILAFVKKDIDTLIKLTRYSARINKIDDIYSTMWRFMDTEEKARMLRNIIRCYVENIDTSCNFILQHLFKAIIDTEPEAFLGKLEGGAVYIVDIQPDPRMPSLPFIRIPTNGDSMLAMILDVEPSGSIHESPKVFGILYGSYLVPVKARNLEEISRIGLRGVINIWNRIKTVLDDEELGNLVSLLRYNSLEIPVVSIGEEDRLVFLTEDMISHIKKLKTLGRYTIYA
jgi:hypothetical protein